MTQREPCGKRCHGSASAARTFLRWMQRKRKTQGHGLREYFCKACVAWHLGHMGSGE